MAGDAVLHTCAASRTDPNLAAALRGCLSTRGRDPSALVFPSSPWRSRPSGSTALSVIWSRSARARLVYASPLGAGRSQVIRMVVARSLVPIGAGLVAGIAGALASSRLLTTLLFQVRPADPVVLSLIAGLLGCVATLACWIPARRAATVDPTIALRTEG